MDVGLFMLVFLLSLVACWRMVVLKNFLVGLSEGSPEGGFVGLYHLLILVGSVVWSPST